MSTTLASLLALAALGEPEVERRAATVEGRSVPLLGADGARKAVNRAAEAAGWQTVTLSTQGCSTDDCYRQAAARAGVTRIFFVDVTPASGVKFKYEVALRVWDAQAATEKRESRICEPCLLRRDFEQTITALATALGAAVDAEVTQARAIPPPPRLVSPPATAPVAAIVAPSPARAARRLALGPVLLGAGVVAAGTGVVLLYLDGHGTECDPACARRYRTQGGLAFVIAGGVAMAVGAWLWAPWSKPEGVAVSLGPGRLAIGGTF